MLRETEQNRVEPFLKLCVCPLVNKLQPKLQNARKIFHGADHAECGHALLRIRRSKLRPIGQIKGFCSELEAKFFRQSSGFVQADIDVPYAIVS